MRALYTEKRIFLAFSVFSAKLGVGKKYFSGGNGYGKTTDQET
jgi:hypothetical protein